MSFKKIFQQSLNNLKGALPFQAHSHHLWPDISKKGMDQYWHDSSSLIDDKWERIFAKIIPDVQKKIAKKLNLSFPKQITFAPNTHELIYRVISSFSSQKNLKILTTSSEFYSLDRQLRRLNKKDNIEICSVDISKFEGNAQKISEQLLKKAKSFAPDLLIFSQCFFDTGHLIPENLITEIALNISEQTLLLIDGYHSFATRPLDFSKIQNRLYFTSGGYKYAMAGEGVCFLYSPPNCKLEPEYTGWMSEIENLSSMKTDQIFYPNDGLRFAGSTFDPSGLYRYQSVWQQFEDLQINLNSIHQHVLELQRFFLQELSSRKCLLTQAKLHLHDLESHAHFFSFEFADNIEATNTYEKLRGQKIICDKRKNTIRLGFGIYLDKEDIVELFRRISI